MDIGDARAWLDAHIDLERTGPQRVAAPSIDRIQALVSALGEPQQDYPVLHITGTNGKGSVAQMATALLLSVGVTCGTYTSPHLQQLNQRIRRNGFPIADDELAAALSTVALAVESTGVTPTWFEILTAAAYRHFSDEGVAAAVVEVGLAGRWDATNVADAAVAAITGVEVDHVEYLGDDPVGIAEEKAGIVKPGSVLVLGETRPERSAPFEAAGAAAVWRRGPDFGCDVDRVAVGGRLVDLRTPGASYPEVFLPVLGSHQSSNAAVALAAVEALQGGPLGREVVEEAFGALELAGRFEVVERHPLVVLDAAHNPSGARVVATTVAEDLGDPGPRAWVVALLDRDPEAFLDALGVDATAGDRVVAVPLEGPRAVAPTAVEAAAESLGAPSDIAPDVEQAMAMAKESVGDNGLVVVTGSLRLVGAARTALGLPAS